MHLKLLNIFTVFIVLFAVIDITGSIPVILTLKRKAGDVAPMRTTGFFERLLGESGILIFKKNFGIILLAIAMRLFLSNTGIKLPHAS
jgi:small neutral amino acid transporter SnatA (MarC family)